MVKIAIVYYSTYGHILKLAEKVKEGIEAAGAQVDIYQVPEILSDEILAKQHAAPKANYPVASADTLTQYDGIVFGFATRYGRVISQMSAFWDSTGQQWLKGSYAGKPVTAFTSTASQGGGQESTIINAVPFFVHHGMVFVPPGYSFGGPMYQVSEVRGGSPWGAGTFSAGDGSRQPSDDELAYAKHQGSYFAGVVKKLSA